MMYSWISSRRFGPVSAVERGVKGERKEGEETEREREGKKRGETERGGREEEGRAFKTCSNVCAKWSWYSHFTESDTTCTHTEIRTQKVTHIVV